MMKKVQDLKLNDPMKQMRDFFQDDSMTRITPSNPYNLLWLVDNYFNQHQQYNLLKNYANEYIARNIKCEIHYLPLEKALISEIREKFIDDKIVMTRVRQLYEQHQVDVSVLACKVIRMSSSFLVEELFKLGMNPNAIDPLTGNTPIFTAIKRKNKGVISTYLNHPNLDITVINKDKNNILFVALENKNWNLVEEIVKKWPKTLLYKKDNINILEYISKLNGGEGLFNPTMTPLNQYNFKKVAVKLKPIIKFMIEYLDNNSITTNPECFSNINASTQDINEINIIYRHEKLNKELKNNKIDKNTMKI